MLKYMQNFIAVPKRRLPTDILFSKEINPSKIRRTFEIMSIKLYSMFTAEYIKNVCTSLTSTRKIYLEFFSRRMKSDILIALLSGIF